ncbi:regulatory protein RecX [Marichromatium bheemlicum]|uniref:Regulatory protein RecX n=2 Tax=Marichromatium bheemlicum TaxID=365339 RepID=A0ABX1I5R5_9GAMM|nr:regulatory protein RecX [Marichromatium bheemlicum]NKN32284.1 regulatory protein RecX [Marichromatium bheemlicum]
MREHARLELTRKLTARGFPAPAIDVVLDRLEAEGALDETRLVERYVAERVEKGFGPLRIRAELNDKGVADALIEPQLRHLREAWPEHLAALHARRFGDTPPADRASYAKRARFLARRGFPTDMIRRLLRWND